MPLDPRNQYYSRALADAARDFMEGNHARGFSELREAARIDGNLAAKADRAEAQFFYMLRFIGSNNDLPDLKGSMADIMNRTEEIMTGIRHKLSEAGGADTFSAQLRYAAMRPEETLESLVSDYLSETERLKTDTAVLTDTRKRATLERIATDIFNRIWITFPLDEHAALLENIITDLALPAYDRAIWTSAIGLQFYNHATSPVLDLLLAVHAAADDEISATAAVWIVLGLSNPAFDSTHLDPDVLTSDFIPRALASMEAANPGDAATILKEWIKTLGTDALVGWFNNEIRPKMNDMGRRFSEKMKDNPPTDPESLTNPDFLTDGNAGSFNALKDFSEKQSRGDDVFMCSLGQMRHFQFFGTLSNWLMPFHTDHSSLSEVVDSEGAAIADTVAAIPMMCDSDKFALILSMAATPAAMRSQAFEALTTQIYAASDMPEFSEMLKKGSERTRGSIISGLIKNLYRFFRLYKGGKEIPDALSCTPPMTLASNVFDDEEGCRAANVIFGFERYKDALEYYSAFASNSSDISTLRNYARACEMAGEYEAALDVLGRIIDLKPDDAEAHIRTGYIYLRKNNPEKALESLEPFEATESKNREFLTTLASVYMTFHRWDDAARVWHNIDYIVPDDSDPAVKAMLGWTLILCGDLDSAESVLSPSGDNSRLQQTRAILLWLQGKRREAVELWSKSVAEPDTKTLLDTDAGRWLMASSDKTSTLRLLKEMDYYVRFGSKFGPMF